MLRMLPPGCKADMTQTEKVLVNSNPCSSASSVMGISSWVFNERLSLTSCCRNSRGNSLIVQPVALWLSCSQEPEPGCGCFPTAPQTTPWLVVIQCLSIGCLSCLMKLDQPWGLFTFAAQPNLTGLPVPEIDPQNRVNNAEFHFFVLFPSKRWTLIACQH